jgi:glucosamine-6-phosphate deaminase
MSTSGYRHHTRELCRFLKERLIDKTGITKHHLLNGEEDPEVVIRRTNEALRSELVDVAFVGVGENGHLAFNDPPADFETEQPYIVVDLDDACRKQQLGEGWFPTLADVPRRAISMSIRQILKTKKIMCIVPDARKANAVKACFDAEISPLAPASILRTHPDTTVYLDVNSAALLSSEAISRRDEVGRLVVRAPVTSAAAFYFVAPAAGGFTIMFSHSFAIKRW